MATATSTTIITAVQDHDLRQRAIAIAAQEGVPLPEAEIAQRIYELVTAPVDDQGNTVASVYEYAAAKREEAIAAIPPAPGADPAAITDAHLAYAIRACLVPKPSTPDVETPVEPTV